jgi:hypothetical protein
MSRQFGLRGYNTELPAFPAGARREIYIPSDFGIAPLKRSKLSQAVIDCLTVLAWLLLGSAGVIAVVGSFAACFFISF